MKQYVLNEKIMFGNNYVQESKAYYTCMPLVTKVLKSYKERIPKVNLPNLQVYRKEDTWDNFQGYLNYILYEVEMV